MTQTDRISTDRIKGVDVFADLSEEELEEVAAAARSRTYEEGKELLHHEEWPQELLVLEEGEVEVRRGGEVIAQLGAGCVVGERGVLRRALRNADVVAATPVKVLYFHRNKVRRLREDIPEIDERLRAVAEEREDR